jgi:hypothetical protein
MNTFRKTNGWIWIQIENIPTDLPDNATMNKITIYLRELAVRNNGIYGDGRLL